MIMILFYLFTLVKLLIFLLTVSGSDVVLVEFLCFTRCYNYKCDSAHFHISYGNL